MRHSGPDEGLKSSIDCAICARANFFSPLNEEKKQIFRVSDNQPSWWSKNAGAPSAPMLYRCGLVLLIGRGIRQDYPRNILERFASSRCHVKPFSMNITKHSDIWLVCGIVLAFIRKPATILTTGVGVKVDDRWLTVAQFERTPTFS